ncbi:hypothetical protein BO226_19190 [Rhodococcus sp. 2G]|uniref:hypothetical protein n=1 Tax=Rhodococcus sp. 2G TaxID=1570939 RepID=UPI0009037DF5|nr:hypothetical protein [Rhodococcus sp. 2G]APE11004.1 hypothetical protein BO226_18850 [Rhodococcus sp. 2G]APE11063.1 hypothetical protein BO226_19190 [Rhodococcus sp. 2G]
MADAIELIAREVAGKLGDQIESRIQEAVKTVSDRVQVEAQRRVDAVVAEIPQIAIRVADQAASKPVPGELVETGRPGMDAKTDAKDRAWRTLVQGIVVTVILAVITAFGAAVAAPDFDLLTWDSWKAAATAGGTAAVMAIVAYFQRLLNPPRNGG